MQLWGHTLAGGSQANFSSPASLCHLGLTIFITVALLTFQAPSAIGLMSCLADAETI